PPLPKIAPLRVAISTLPQGEGGFVLSILALVLRLVRRSSKSEDGSLGEGGSLACEIVRTHRMAQIRPALRAPVIDEAGFANERFEAFRLAQGAVFGKP